MVQLLIKPIIARCRSYGKTRSAYTISTGKVNTGKKSGRIHNIVVYGTIVHSAIGADATLNLIDKTTCQHPRKINAYKQYVASRTAVIIVDAAIAYRAV